MQNFKDITVDNIPWLPASVITGASKTDAESTIDKIDLFTRVSDAVRAFIDVDVGNNKYQLQRVIAKCELEFSYLSFDDELDPLAEEYLPSVEQVSPVISNLTDFVNCQLLNLNHFIPLVSFYTSGFLMFSEVFRLVA